MNIPGILYASAAVLFLLAAFGASLSDDINLVSLGLALVAAGMAISALGVGTRVRRDH